MKKIASLLVLSLGLISGAHAADLSGALGGTGQGGTTARIAVGFNWDKDWLQSSVGHVTGYWDLGYTYWEAGDQAGARHSVSFSPVFVYEFGNGSIKPFVEAGIGASMFTGASAGDRKFGSSYNFEDRIGAGLKFADGQKVGVRAIHYSNGSTREPNEGIESYSLFYSHPL